jgi:sugar phosphate isomerase/epimerase
VGAQGFQVYVSGGDLHPSKLSAADRADFVRLVRDKGLEVAALCGEIGGYCDPDRGDWAIEETKAYLDLSVDLGPRIVTAHLGVIPESSSDPAWSAIARVLEAVGRHGDKIGAVFACETGPEAPELMRRFIDQLDTSAIRVNYDPANLVMMGFDPIAGVEALGHLVVHTHAKDGLRHSDGRMEEVPLGQGAVPFREWIGALAAKGYSGYYTVERECGDNAYGDIADAVAFLRSV